MATNPVGKGTKTIGLNMRVKVIILLAATLLCGGAKADVVVSGDIAAGSGVITLTHDLTYSITSSGNAISLIFEEWVTGNWFGDSALFVVSDYPSFPPASDVITAAELIPEPSSVAMIGLVSGCGVFIRKRFMI